MRSDLDKLWAKVAIDPSGCWLWTGRLAVHNGYGEVDSAPHRGRKSHRVFYEALVGPVPDGLELDHLCRNRICVNPAHLEPVTHIENVKRGSRATATCCKHGHPYDDENTIWRRDFKGRPFRRCKTCDDVYRQRWAERRAGAA